MKRWAKFLLLAVGSGVALLIVAGIFLKIYFNEARLRALILPPVREALGREVDISSISIDLFRGVRIGGLIVKEADGEGNFVSIDELGLNYSLLPLLQRRLEIGRIWLEKPTIRLRKNLDGSFNYADLKFLKSSGKVVENSVETQVEGRGDRTPVVLPLALAVQRCDVSGITMTFIDESGELPKVDFNADLTSKLDLGDLRPESI
ncbi:AsmA family protein, partial [bacterium]|nr:AsmA family protein [bacterium]